MQLNLSFSGIRPSLHVHVPIGLRLLSSLDNLKERAADPCFRARSAGVTNNLSPHIMWSPFRYSVFRLIRPDQSERVERSPLVQTYPPWNARNYPPWKRIPLELNCSRL